MIPVLTITTIYSKPLPPFSSLYRHIAYLVHISGNAFYTLSVSSQFSSKFCIPYNLHLIISKMYFNTGTVHVPVGVILFLVLNSDFSTILDILVEAFFSLPVFC